MGNNSIADNMGLSISYYSLIVTLDVSPTIFEILTFTARKWIVFPTPPLFDAPARKDETYPAKTRVMGLLYGEMLKSL